MRNCHSKEKFSGNDISEQISLKKVLIDEPTKQNLREILYEIKNLRRNELRESSLKKLNEMKE
jgi:hypothetical protein